MASADSKRLQDQLRHKLKATEIDAGKRDHIWWEVRDPDDGMILGFAKFSRGPRETLGNHLLDILARTLGLSSARQVQELASCPLSGKEALAIMRSAQAANNPAPNS